MLSFSSKGRSLFDSLNYLSHALPLKLIFVASDFFFFDYYLKGTF